jgi:polyhydroxyalkanoate synthesis regulator phasin
MIDLIKKAMFTGIGVATLTRDKIEEISREFIEKGKLSESEGKKLVDDLMTKSEKAKNDAKDQVEGYVKMALNKMDLASSSELDELKKEIAELKKILESKS